MTFVLVITGNDFTSILISILLEHYIILNLFIPFYHKNCETTFDHSAILSPSSNPSYHAWHFNKFVKKILLVIFVNSCNVFVIWKIIFSNKIVFVAILGALSLIDPKVSYLNAWSNSAEKREASWSKARPWPWTWTWAAGLTWKWLINWKVDKNKI